MTATAVLAPALIILGGLVVLLALYVWASR